MLAGCCSRSASPPPRARIATPLQVAPVVLAWALLLVLARR